MSLPLSFIVSVLLSFVFVFPISLPFEFLRIFTDSAQALETVVWWNCVV